jgi:transposase
MEKDATETFVGLDVHKEIVFATALDPQGHKVSEARFSSEDAELIRYLGSVPGTKHVVSEACSVWEHLYEAAVSTGAEVTLSHPYKTRIISEASLKSDRVDSQVLANLLRLGSVPKAYVPEPEIRALRQVVQNRAFCRRKSIATQNRIYSILLLKGIRYEPVARTPVDSYTHP